MRERGPKILFWVFCISATIGAALVVITPFFAWKMASFEKGTFLRQLWGDRTAILAISGMVGFLFGIAGAVMAWTPAYGRDQ